MKISVQELREKLIPQLCSLMIGCKKCSDSRCSKAIKNIQEWLDDLLMIEQGGKVIRNGLQIMGDNKDWTAK